MKLKRFFFSLLLAALCITACETTTPATRSVLPEQLRPTVITPFTLSASNQFLIELNLNGEGPFTFMIDTGATLSAIYPHAVNRLALPINEVETTWVHGIIESDERPVTYANSLEIGAITRNKFRMVILEASDAAKIDGILGMDVMSDFAILFDHQTNTITFMDPRSVHPVLKRTWGELELIPNPFTNNTFNLIFTKLTLTTTPVVALVDLGSTISIQNWASANNSKLKSIRRRLHEQWELEGSVGEFKPRILATYGSIYTDKLQWQKMELYVRELDTLKVMGLEDQPLMIMGLNFFVDTTFLIDFPNMRTYFNTEDSPITALAEEVLTGSRIRDTNLSKTKVRTRD